MSEIDYMKLVRPLPGESRPSSGDSAVDSDSITFYTLEGEPMVLAKEVWVNEMLPRALQRAWNDPHQLTQIIMATVADGYPQRVEEAVLRLADIDSEPQRWVNALALVRAGCGELDEAAHTLECYVETLGPQSEVLTTLAKVYVQRGEKVRVEPTLRQALAANPNDENALAYYVQLVQERLGPSSAEAALLQCAGVPGAFYPQIMLARYDFEHAQPDRACERIRQALPLVVASGHATAMSTLTETLRQYRCFDLLVDRVAAVYDLERHGVHAGLDLLRAYARTQRIEPARALADKLRPLVRPHIRAVFTALEAEVGASSPLRNSPGR